LNVEGLAVDACRGGCGGIWFDNFELSRVDEAKEKLGEVLAALEFDPNAVVLREKRPCPKCAGITMLQHKFSREKPVTVDECPNCGGVWLDGGELAEIRRPVTTAGERKQATQAFFSRLAAAELAQLRSRRTGL
jgi:Zn-finger nucleic acid-binding protein